MSTLSTYPLQSAASMLLPLGVSQKAHAASGTSTSGTGSASSSTSSSQTSLSALGSTFLQLLTEELQNQDPTAPMDSTAMVGQMISLNQLDQIASINQLLTNTLGSSGAASSSTGGSSSGSSSSVQTPATNAL